MKKYRRVIDQEPNVNPYGGFVSLSIHLETIQRQSHGFYYDNVTTGSLFLTLQIHTFDQLSPVLKRALVLCETKPAPLTEGSHGRIAEEFFDDFSIVRKVNANPSENTVVVKHHSNAVLTLTGPSDAYLIHDLVANLPSYKVSLQEFEKKLTHIKEVKRAETDHKHKQRMLDSIDYSKNRIDREVSSWHILTDAEKKDMTERWKAYYEEEVKKLTNSVLL